MALFHRKKVLKPSSIEGYRSALANKLSHIQDLDIGHNKELNKLFASFHRDRPKALRQLPDWDLGFVLNVLTQSPFEPLGVVSMKHLTLKTVFLVSLASGKRRSEIHALVRNRVRHSDKWAEVTLEPSPDFIAKNQLAKEGASCIKPVKIPSLSKHLDADLTEDRTLCPVRAIRFYLDRTQGIIGDRKKIFISYKTGHKTEISAVTISSWLKRLILLAYQSAGEDT